MSFFTTVDQVFADWNYTHPHILYGLVRSLRPKVIVNCGTFLGLSAAWMAKACQENNFGRVICMDNWSEKWADSAPGNSMKERCINNLTQCGVIGFIDFIDGDTRKVKWPASIDFAYVDAWHGHPTAFDDWSHCVEAGAECICLDDTVQCVGPRLLMQDIRRSESWDVMDIDRDCGLSICMRKKPLRPITFSQELADSIGTDLTQLTGQEQHEHFAQAAEENGIDYSSIIGLVHPPKP